MVTEIHPNVNRELQAELEVLLDKIAATGMTAHEIEEWVKEGMCQWEGWPLERREYCVWTREPCSCLVGSVAEAHCLLEAGR